MGKTEEDLNGLKLGFLKTVQPNSFSKLIAAAGVKHAYCAKFMLSLCLLYLISVIQKRII